MSQCACAQRREKIEQSFVAIHEEVAERRGKRSEARHGVSKTKRGGKNVMELNKRKEKKHGGVPQEGMQKSCDILSRGCVDT